MTLLNRVRFTSHAAFAAVAGQLYERSGGGATEAGCFVLGTISGAEGVVHDVIYFDDLDPDAYRYRAISFNTATMGPLYDRCEREGLSILADMHTHPCRSFQSPIDKAHPVVAVAGHIAIVLPYDGRYRATHQIGAYVLQADGDWVPHPNRSIDDLLGLNAAPRSAAEFDRTELLLVHQDRTTDQRRALLNGLSIHIIASDEQCDSATGQAAIITAVALSTRFARAGVYVSLGRNAQLAIAPATSLSDVVEMLGASLLEPARPSASIVIGDVPSLPAGFTVRVIADGGEYGCAPASHQNRLRDAYVPGVLLGTALSVGEIFRRFVLGKIESIARLRTVRLFYPNEMRAIPSDFGDRLDAVWLAGFGHLGNAYAWCMALTPTMRPELLVQDRQRVDLANAGTQLFVVPADIGRRKTDVANDQLERLGFAVRIDDRELDGDFTALDGSPTSIIAGFDNTPARRALSRSGAGLIIDGGLGSTSATFSSFLVNVLRDPKDAIDAFVDEGYVSNAEAFVGRAAFKELDVSKDSKCGLLYPLADTAVAVPFVGVCLAAIALTQLVRVRFGLSVAPVIAGDSLAAAPLSEGLSEPNTATHQ